MTSYFDKAQNAVSALSEVSSDDTFFMVGLALIEKKVIDDVNLATGDREFPEEWRERIQGCIAVHRVAPPTIPNLAAESYAKTTRSSEMISIVHRLFHHMASERIETRFGLLTDSPTDIVKRRDAHDEENA